MLFSVAWHYNISLWRFGWIIGVVQTISVDCYLFNWKPSICHIFDGCADILYKDQTSDVMSDHLSSRSFCIRVSVWVGAIH